MKNLLIDKLFISTKIHVLLPKYPSTMISGVAEKRYKINFVNKYLTSDMDFKTWKKIVKNSEIVNFQMVRLIENEIYILLEPHKYF